MLFENIMTLEDNWPEFNLKKYSVGDIIKLAKKLDIFVLKDRTVTSASIFQRRDKKIILYNPDQPQIDLILALGHELGHAGLGHVKPNSAPLHSNFFETDGIEKDAGVIGFLFWHPSLELHHLDIEGRLDIEEVYKYHKNTNGSDLLEDDLMKLCMSRLRIYKGLIRTLSR